MSRSLMIEMQIDLSPAEDQETTWARIRQDIDPDADYEPGEDHEGLEIKLQPPNKGNYVDEGTIRWCDPKSEYDRGDKFWYSDELAWNGPWGGYCLQHTIAYEDGCTWQELEDRRRQLYATAEILAQKYDLKVGEVSILPLYF